VSVTITGTDFSGVSAVKFGSLNAASYSVDSASQITATAPAHSAGMVDIRVIAFGGTSVKVEADRFTYVPNAAPVASAVSISGTAMYGQTLTGSYTYTDAESDAQGASTFKWYRADDASGTNKAAIAGATSTTYTLTAADAGKHISFEVTPVAQTGTSPGIAVESAFTGKVTEPFYVGNALHFDDADDRLYINSPLTTQVDNITMETWVKADTISSADTYIRIMYNGNSSNSGYGIYLAGASKSVAILVGGLAVITPSTPVTLNTGQWYHIAAVRDNGAWKLYVNGVLQPLTNFTIPNTPTQQFSVGNSYYSNENFVGCIDETRFWTVARTQQQIQDNMYIKLTGEETGLLAYYNYDQGTPAGDNTAISTVINSVSGGSNLSLSGFALSGTTSNFIQSVQMGTFQLENATYEVNENEGAVSVSIVRTGGSEGSVTINYETQDGTATAGTNYTDTTGSVTFASGEASKTISIPIINNHTAGDLSFSISLSALDGVAFGENKTATINISPNSAPMASAVSIAGMATYGQTLTGSYTYSDTESDAQGASVFKWYRADNASGLNKEPISGATGITYTLQTADVGKYISFEVTPVANTGASPGTAVSSDYTAAVQRAECATEIGITPVLSSKTDTSVTLTSVAGYEYICVANGAAVSTGTWQDSNTFTGLEASTAYDFYQRVKETATHKASAVSSKLDVSTDGAPLTGTATISGTAAYGQTLTASLTGSNNTGTLSYQWMRDGSDISSATSSTYTLAEDDIGSTISVKITSDVQTGTRTSAATSVVQKADAASPAAPVLSGKTQTSVTLTAAAGYEYICVADGAAVSTGTWQDSNVFSGLTSATAYDIYQRIKETATHHASAVSTKLDVTTDGDPLTGTANISGTAVFGQTLTASLTGSNNSGTLSYQWVRGSSDISSATGSTYTLVEADIGSTISVKITSSVETGTRTSAATSAVQKADAASPAAPALSGKTQASVTLAPVAGYEYICVADGAAVSTGTWQDSNVFSGLTSNTAYDFYQRVKETATHKASVVSSKLGVTTAAPALTEQRASRNGGIRADTDRVINRQQQYGNAFVPVGARQQRHPVRNKLRIYADSGGYRRSNQREDHKQRRDGHRHQRRDSAG
jgi:hypothetical protein